MKQYVDTFEKIIIQAITLYFFANSAITVIVSVLLRQSWVKRLLMMPERRAHDPSEGNPFDALMKKIGFQTEKNETSIPDQPLISSLSHSKSRDKNSKMKKR